MNRHNYSRGNSHWNKSRDRHSSNRSQGYNQDRGRLRYRHDENSHRSHSHHHYGRSRSHLNVNGKRSRSNDSIGFNQLCARSEHHFENHSRGNGNRWESPSSLRQQHSPALEDGEIEEMEITMEQHQEHRKTNSSNMQLHSNETQLSSRNRPQQHPHTQPQYNRHTPQHSSWNMPQQLRLHSGNRYDHHAHQHDHSNDQVPWHAPLPRAQPSFHDHRHNRVTQQRPYARPQYAQVQSSRPFRPDVRFESYFSANKLVQTAMQNSLFLDPFLLSVFWNKLSKKVGKGQARDDYSRDNGEMERNLSQIFDLTQRKIGSFQPRHLSLTIHGIAKVVSVVKEGGSIRDGNCVEAAFHTLLLDNTVHHGLFDTVANHIVTLESLTGFDSQSLSNIAWAFAKVELPQPELFSKIAEHITALQRLDGFNSQALSNTLWAFAKVELPHCQLFGRIAEHITALHSLDEYMSQELSNTLWAFAKVEIFHQELFRKVNDHFMRVYLV